MAWLSDSLLPRRQWLAIGGVAAAYYITARLGLSFALPQTNVTPVWIPSGISLAALLLGGVGLWPAVALGSFLANLLVLWQSGAANGNQVLFASLSIAVGDTLEALLGSSLFRRYIGPAAALPRSRDPLILAAVAAVSSLLAAAIGVAVITATALTPRPLAAPALLTWWLGDVTGILVITPLLLAIAGFSTQEHDFERVPLLWGLFLAAVGLTAIVVFGGVVPHQASASVKFLILPVVLVAAIWGGPLLTQLSVVVIAAVAVYAAVSERGRFLAASVHSSLLLVQAFTCVLALAGGTLAAAVAELKMREKLLNRTNRALQVLTCCNSAVTEAIEERQLLQQVCRVAVDTAGYELVFIGYAEQDEARTVRPVAYAGPAERYLGRVRLSWADNEYGRGVVGRAIRAGRPFVAHDLPHHPDYQAWRDLVAESGFRSAAAVPVKIHDASYGGFAFFSREPHAFRPSELELLTELGMNLAHGIRGLRTQKQREQARQEVVRRNQELATLAAMFRETTAKVDLRALLSRSLHGAMELTGLDGGVLCMLSGNGCMKLGASANLSAEIMSDLSSGRFRVGDCLCGKAFQTGAPVVTQDDASEAAAGPLGREGIRFHAAFPMKSRGRVLGVLCVFTRTDYRPDQRRLDLVQDTCGPLALAIENAMLYEQVQKHAAELEERVRQRTAELQAEAAQRESAQISLRESERKYRELVENANSIILKMDQCGRITFLNEFGQRFFGYQEEELLGRNVIGTIVPRTETSGRDLESLILDTATHPDRHLSNENENIRRDGRRAWISWTNRPILDGEGRMLGCLSVGNDITALKSAEAQLEKAKDAAESADRLKSAFLATMSHELRTPLNSIIGFAGILLQELPGPLNGEQRNQLGMLRGAASHLLALINDVLDISKIEAGQVELQRVPFNLPLTIERVVDTVRPLARNKQLRLLADVNLDMPQLSGDQRRVEQVLLNLLSNAIKFTDQGEVTLRCTREQGEVVISVQDTGCGIPEAHRRTLFRPFRQLDTGLARKHEGTGLGLAICARLVAMMGGRIDLASEVGKGSVFTVRLPEQPPDSRPS